MASINHGATPSNTPYRPRNHLGTNRGLCQLGMAGSEDCPTKKVLTSQKAYILLSKLQDNYDTLNHLWGVNHSSTI